MSEEKTDTDKRPRTVPIFGDQFEWWTNAVRRQLNATGSDQKQLATKLGVSPAQVSRCITRQIPTYDLLIAISNELKIAFPVILPESEEEAVHLAAERRVLRRVAKARKIKAGVPGMPNEDQAPGVVSEHAVRSQETKTSGRPGTGRKQDSDRER